MTAPTRDTLTQAFKALATGRPGAAEALADMFLGNGDQAEAIEPGEPAQSRVHTYADGSQVVGMPPFPELSPIELKAAEARRVGAPAEQPTEPPAPAVVTADQIETTLGSTAVTPPAPAPVDVEPAAAAPASEAHVDEAPAVTEAAAVADPAPAPAPATSRKR